MRALAALSRLTRHRAVRVTARLLLAAVFLVAAVPKLLDPDELRQAILGYRLVPPTVAALAAAALPPVELCLGLALALGAWVRAAALAALGLLSLFVLAGGSALARGIDTRCGCFGGAEALTAWTLARDLGLVALALVVLRGADAPAVPPTSPAPTDAAPGRA